MKMVLNGVGIIFNGVGGKDSYGYQYGYKYGYKYGYWLQLWLWLWI